MKQIGEAYLCVANICRKTLHQAATSLTRTTSAIVLEDLNVAGMMKNRHLAQAIEDVGLYEFRRQLQYKGAWYGCQIKLADRFYPFTKLPSGCGQLREIELSEREYHSPACGLVLDRDLNAAINLEQLLVQESTASSAGIYTCGVHVSPWVSGDAHGSRNRTSTCSGQI